MCSDLQSTYEIGVSVAPLEGTAKGVIHNVPDTDDEDTVTSKSLVNARNPTILQAHCEAPRSL